MSGILSALEPFEYMDLDTGKGPYITSSPRRASTTKAEKPAAEFASVFAKIWKAADKAAKTPLRSSMNDVKDYGTCER